jgi:hypothetical protein
MDTLSHFTRIVVDSLPAFRVDSNSISILRDSLTAKSGSSLPWAAILPSIVAILAIGVSYLNTTRTIGEQNQLFKKQTSYNTSLLWSNELRKKSAELWATLYRYCLDTQNYDVELSGLPPVDDPDARTIARNNLRQSEHDFRIAQQSIVFLLDDQSALKSTLTKIDDLAKDPVHTMKKSGSGLLLPWDIVYSDLHDEYLRILNEVIASREV